METVGGEGALRQHILDMGLIPGVEVTMVKFAPMVDPLEIRVHSYELTNRVADAEKMEITPVTESQKKKADAQNGERLRPRLKKEGIHPGLGEGGKWAVGVVLEQCEIAWLAAFVVRLIGLLLGAA